MNVRQYITEIKAKLVASSAVTSFSIVEEQALEDRGYFRARIFLANGDFLEVAEYFILTDFQPKTERYRYQWMNGQQTQLIKRWDNVPHFPNLDNFPHHVHITREDNVEPSQSQNILQVLSFVEQEIIRNSED
ncbi:MAG: DUF6516 family protein [Synechocystis sp.]|nr:DUF6516 family protein [Synechocystis sp.]